MSENKRTSFLQSLWDRKVPQYLGTYFAIGFGILQFFEFVTRRYDLGHALIDKYLLMWLLLIPAIVILIYFGGELKFKSTSHRWPKVFVIANFAIVIVLATLLFNEKIVQEKKIALVNEEGETVEVIVPPQHKIKKVAIFQLTNGDSKQEYDWYSAGLSELLERSLLQRSEYYVASVYNLNPYNETLGLPPFESPNLGMKREIAKKSSNDYYTNLSYKVGVDTFEIYGDLIETKSGKTLVKLSANAANAFLAVDKIQMQIIAEISGDVEGEEVNLPSEGLITNNIEALKNRTLGFIMYYKDPTRLEEVLVLHKKSVQLDSNCSACYYNVGDVLYGLGRLDEAIVEVKKAVRYAKSLPQRFQFYAKNTLYSLTKNMDAYYKLQEMHKEMFPYEFSSYEHLVGYYQSEFGVNKAKALIQEAIDNGIVERGLSSMYDLLLDNEEYDEALTVLKRLSKEFPYREQDRAKYATVYASQGALGKAKELYLEEETLDPFDPRVQNSLAFIDFRNNNITQAYERIDRGLSGANSLRDSLFYLWSKSYLYEFSGEIGKAQEYVDLYEKNAIKRSPKNRVVVSTFQRKVAMCQSIGDWDCVISLLEEIETYAPENSTTYKCIVNTRALQNNYKKVMSVETYELTCPNEYSNYGKGGERMLELIVAYNKKDYETCKFLLEEENQKLIKLMDNSIWITQVYEETGDIEKAIDLITPDIIAKPVNPEYYLRMATLLALKDRNRASEYLDIALNFWSNADPSYRPYKEAQALLQEVGEYKLKM